MARLDAIPKDSHPHSHHHYPHPLGFLAWIAGYKLLKAVLMIVAAVTALHLVHRDLGEVVLSWVVRLHLDPQGPLVTHVMHRVMRVHSHGLHALVAVLLGYAVIYVVEGVGLFFEKRWAEWLTIVQTCLLIPLELYHTIWHFGWIKLGLLLLNLAVVAYLLWRMRHDDVEDAMIEAAIEEIGQAGSDEAISKSQRLPTRSIGGDAVAG